MAKKVYAVAVGRQTGLFYDWDTCEQQVKGYPNAKFKGFSQEKAAREWLGACGSTVSGIKEKKEKTTWAAREEIRRQENSKFDYIIYTDGGCSTNPGGRGGIGIVILNTRTGKKTEHSEGYFCTTNNRMEILAVARALELVPNGSKVQLRSDSQYVVKTMKGQYAKHKNIDLWERLDQAMVGKEVSVYWVKGHAGNPYNERCDRLAAAAMRNPTKEDVGE